MLPHDHIYVNFFKNNVTPYIPLNITRQNLNHKIDNLRLT